MFVAIRYVPKSTTPSGVEFLSTIRYAINMRCLRHHEFAIVAAKIRRRWRIVRVSLGVKPSLASYGPGTNSALKDKDCIWQLQA
jgi:hypothetical protein